MTNTAETLLCLASLRQLRQDVGEQLFPELIALFISDTQQNLLLLQQAMAAVDLPQLIHQAHTLKSVCATYGARLCQEQAISLEAAARQGDSQSIARWGQALMQTLPQTMTAMRCWCDEACSSGDQETSR